MAIGSRVHAALEAHYRGFNAREVLTKAHQAAGIGFDEETAVLEDTMLRTYCDHVVTQEDNWETLATEKQYTLPFHTIGDNLGIRIPDAIADWELTGIIDLIIRKPDGTVWGVDHKTVKTFPTHNLNQDEQLLTYRLLMDAGHKHYVGASDGGFIYNALRKVTPSKRTKPPYVQRYEIKHSLTQVQQHAQHLVGVAMDLWETIQLLEAGSDHHLTCYPTPGMHCGWSCPFKNVCPMMDDDTRWEAALDDLFVEKPSRTVPRG